MERQARQDLAAEVVSAVRGLSEEQGCCAVLAVDVARWVFGSSEDYGVRHHSYLVRTSHALRRAARAGGLVCLRPRPRSGLGGTCRWALPDTELDEETLRDYFRDGESSDSRREGHTNDQETTSDASSGAPLSNRQLFDGLNSYVNEVVERVEHYVRVAADSRDASGDLVTDALDLDAADDGLALAARSAALLDWGERRARAARAKLERSDWTRW